jgi:putative DNA-binding protein
LDQRRSAEIAIMMDDDHLLPLPSDVHADQCLGARQRDFVDALLDPERQIPAGLVGPDGRPDSKRFNVYRNNVVAGLTAALKEAFPAVARIVGDEFFAAMARFYVVAEPPKGPVMLHYGEGFPAFIGSFAPAQSIPYLSDIACLEWAWVEAYHAPDARPLDPAEFAAIDPPDLPHLHLILHPSLRLIRSQFPSLAIWQMNIEGGIPRSVDLHLGGDDILVLRPHADVAVRLLPPGGAEFVRALIGRRTVIEATKDAMAADPRFDLTVNLSGLINANAFARFETVAGPVALARPA